MDSVELLAEEGVNTPKGIRTSAERGERREDTFEHQGAAVIHSDLPDSTQQPCKAGTHVPI